LAVLEKLVRRGEIRPGQRTVVISTANGLKFTDFKVRYHDDTLQEFGVRAQHPNRPIELPPDYEAVKSAVFSG
jgi:threonine synthase